MTPASDVENAVLSGDVHFNNEGPQRAEASAGSTLFSFGPGKTLTKVHADQNVKLLQHQYTGADTEQDVEVTAPAMDYFIAGGQRLTKVESIGPPQVLLLPADKKKEQTRITGDKFTPQARVYIDSQELPTTYTSAQQLSAQVPAALIAAPGTRQVIVRTPDGQLYSNPLTINVADPPKPQFTYIGLLGGPHYNDKAMIKTPTPGSIITVQRGDQNIQATEVATVQRGDVVGGRFRVTSISERSIDLVDTQLRIKHTLPYVEARNTGAPGGPRPYSPQQPPTADDDDEPN